MLKGEGLSGRVWETGQPLAIPDYSRWEGRVRQVATDAFRAVLGVPLVSGGTVYGVIGLAFSEPGRTFTDDEVTQVSRFAEVASIALDNARLYAAAQQELVERQKAEQPLPDPGRGDPGHRLQRGVRGRRRPPVHQPPGRGAVRLHRRGGQPGQLLEDAPSTPTTWRRVLAEEARCEQTGEPFRMEYRFFTKSGEVKWVRDQCVLVRDAAGTPLFWQGVSVDITDTKRALEHEREATRRLRALDQMKNTFLDAVSHELRTPLAAIVGIGLTLEHKADNLADADRSDLYTRLVANARKLDRLLNDLLDLDRLTHGIVAPKRRPTDVAALAGRIADDWGLLNGRRPQVVAEPVTVSLDPGKVERIIENLLANAARHTPPDTPVWVRVEQPPGGDGVLLAVEDAGAGVPAELRDSVFEPFRQGPDTPTHAPGVGIGLTLVARFAELHGGGPGWRSGPGAAPRSGS